MKPDAKHVKPLESFDASAFANWLRRGFEDLHHEERRLTAFAPLNYFVGRYGDLTSDLKNIYDVLSGSAQGELRFGIARAFSDLPPAQRSVPIVRSLLHLAGRVHATEIFPEVIKQVGNGFFGMPEHIEGCELFALTLDIVAGMSPAHGVGDAVLRLVGSSFFQPGYAPRAFIALCRAEPEKFPIHLKLLRGRFRDLHQKEGKDDAFITARRFVQYVDLVVIGRNLWRLHLCTRPDVDALSTDNWLVEALFFDDRAPLISTKYGDDFVIARRDQIQTSMKIHLEADKNVWSDVDDVRRFLNQCLERNRSKMWEEVDMAEVGKKLMFESKMWEEVDMAEVGKKLMFESKMWEEVDVAEVGKKLMFESKDRTHPTLTVEQCNLGELFETNSALYLFPQTDKTRTGIRELSH